MFVRVRLVLGWLLLCYYVGVVGVGLMMLMSPGGGGGGVGVKRGMLRCRMDVLVLKCLEPEHRRMFRSS